MSKHRSIHIIAMILTIIAAGLGVPLLLVQMNVPEAGACATGAVIMFCTVIALASSPKTKPNLEQT